MPENRVAKIALFDFDGTLTVKDSFIGFSLFALGRKVVIKAVFKSFFSLIGWKCGFVDASRAKECLFGNLFKGMRYELFCRAGEEYADKIDTILNNEVYNSLDKMDEADVKCVIVTASMAEWIAPWAKRHGVRQIISTRPAIGNDGCLTGKFATQNCKGVEKKRRLLAEIQGVEQMEIHAWGNLPDDKEMLEMAKYPHRV